MKNYLLIGLMLGIIIVSGCAQIDVPGTSEPQQSFERYIIIGSNYNENPHLGEIIDFPIEIQTVQKDLIGASGYLNFYEGTGIKGDDSIINFVLRENSIVINIPLTIEGKNILVKSGEFFKFSVRGKVIHEGKEISFGRLFYITPYESKPNTSEKFREAPLE